MATLNDLAVSVIKLGETLERVKREIEAMDDKQPKVWLTVWEAKRVQSALYELLRNSNDKNSKEWLTYWMVNGRIEQAEKQDGKTL